MAQSTVVGGITNTQAGLMGMQRRLFLVGSYYYALYQSGGDIYYKKSTDGGSTWGSAQQVNSDISTQYQPSGWLDGTDIHIVYHEISSDTIHHRILDTTDDSLGTENSTADLGSLDTNNINLVTVDSGGRIYIMNSSDPDFQYSDNGGSSWSSNSNIYADATEYCNMIAIGTDLHYVQNAISVYDLEWSTYDGSSWTNNGVQEAGLISNATPHMAEDGSGGFYVSYPDVDDSFQTEIQVHYYNGSTWTKKTSVVGGSPTGLQSFSNTICVDTNKGDVYAFYTYDGGGSGEDVVYYKKSTDNGDTWGSETEAGFTAVASMVYACALYSNGTALAALAADLTNENLVFNKVTGFAEVNTNSSKASVVRTRGTHSIVQNQDTNNVNSINGGTGGSSESSQAWGQSFTASGNRLVSITARLYKYNSPTDDLNFDIVSTLGGSSLGQATIDSSTISAGSTYTLDFDSPISLTEGNTYYVEITRSGARDETNRPAIYIYYGGITNDGVAYSRSDNSWSVDGTNTDLRISFDFEDLPQSTKANIVATNSQDNSVKAEFNRDNLKNANSVKANILKTDQTQDNSALGNIVYLVENVNSVKASIVVENTNDQSVKGNINVPTTHDSSVKASFYDVYRNTVKANIISPQTQGNSVKANIPVDVYSNRVKGQIKRKPYIKTYEYRIYDNDSYVNTWVEEVVSDPSFRTIINGGASELTVRLAREFDNFGEDEDVKLNNRVDVWCFDREAPNGVRIYRGYVSGYRPIVEGSNEYVEVTLLSYLAETSGIIVRGSDGSTQYAQNSLDPSTIMQNVVLRARDKGALLYFTEDSIDTTGTTVSYQFETDTARDAFDKIIELSPDGWYWYLDSDAFIQMHAKPSSATHIFRVGREVAAMETWRRGEDIVNEVFFVGGGDPQMFRYYKNDGSIDAYGRRGVKKIDQRVTNTGTADIIANRVINAKKDPEIRTRVTINDSNNNLTGYDIESIKVGDTIQIGNLKQGIKTVTLWDVGQWDEDVWDQTLAYSAVSAVQILSVDYRPDQVVLEASSRIPEITKRIEDINRNAETTVLVNNPSSPTDA